MNQQIRAATFAAATALLLFVAIGTGCDPVRRATPDMQGKSDGGARESAAQSARIIDVRAEEQIRRMANYLKGLKQFRFEVDAVSDDYLVEDELIQRSRRIAVSVQRPQRVHSVVTSDKGSRDYWFDGAHLTYLSDDDTVYSVVDIPGDIDTWLDTLADKYGIVVPVLEFLSEDSFQWLMGSVTDAEYVGETTLGGEKCVQLAFRQPTLDWQIWISTGDAALPRKLVIRYKLLEGYPQYSATFTKWETNPSFPAADLDAKIPTGATQVEFQPRHSAVGGGTRPQ